MITGLQLHLAMNNIQKKLSILIFITVSVNLNAQRLKSFTHDPAIYVAELRGLLEEANKKDGIADATPFENFVLSGSLNAERMELLYALSDQMLKKRTPAYPGFYGMMESVRFLYTQENFEEADKWLVGMTAYAKDNSGRSASTVMEHFHQFFYDRVLYSSNALTWQIRNGFYTFSFEESPEIQISEIDLFCLARNDSAVIYETSGRYYPAQEVFNGFGGKLLWTRCTFTEDSLNAELSNYKVILKKSRFEADSVVLNSKFYINDPILGRLEENIQANASRDRARYPQFHSYSKSYVLNDIYEGVNFIGGFGVEGCKFVGFGTDKEYASMGFEYEDNTIIQVRSPKFSISDDRAVAQDCEVSIRLDEDSIYHPRLNLKFDPTERVVSLIRENEGLSQRPVMDSYHDVEMFFEILVWDMDNHKIDFSNIQGGNVNPVVFESVNFYRDERFEAYQGMDDSNPIYELYRLYERSDHKTDFWIEEIAYFLRMDDHKCRVLMMNMTISGFVNYDLKEGKVYIQQKLFDYVNARGGFRDYDVIRFVSVTEKPVNASLSLLDYDISMEGVKLIALSDSQEVFLYPAEDKIKLKEGRDFEFDGLVQAGRFDFYGRNLFFDYQNFRINFATIDSMKFLVPGFETDDYGRRALVLVRNMLQNMNGELFIDKPNNKSSMSNYPEYPIFRSGTDSYVYWDDRKIYNGVYDRNDVYFHIQPFEIDSLDNFKTESLEFDGRFYSGRIFPDFPEKLKVQPDYSLGFRTKTPSGGYPVYNGEGQFGTEIWMNNKGLHGNGELEYLSSTSYSKNFSFFLDSVRAIMVDSFHIAPSPVATEYPVADVVQARILWNIDEQKMDVYNRPEHLFAIFENNTSLNGGLTLYPTALEGYGLASFENAQTKSNLYIFEHNRFYADTLDFKLKLHADAKWAFELDTAYGDIDFDRRLGEFRIYNDADPIEMALNSYQAFMNHVWWDMDKKWLDLEQIDESPGRMLSVAPRQDSLDFMAGQSRFHLTDTLLEAFEAPLIVVGDAQVHPDSGYVRIGANANMHRLENATMEADAPNLYHNFYNASIKIRAKNEFRAEADLDYLDQDLVVFPIHFGEMGIDTAGQTYAIGDISKEDEFFLSPYFSFHGKVELYARESSMIFDGFTEIQHACEEILTDEIPFRAAIDPNSIYVDLSRFEEERSKYALESGLYFNPDPPDMRSAFLSKLELRDTEIFSTRGFLHYDEGSNQYLIASMEKLENQRSPGNILKFSNKDCEVIGDGSLMMDEGMGQVEIQCFGSFIHDLALDTLAIDAIHLVDFPILEEFMVAMSAELLDDNSLQGIDPGRDVYERAIINVLGEKEGKAYLNEIGSFGSVDKMPKELQKSLVFGDLKMVWNEYTSSFVSEGLIGIANIGSTQINRKVEGKVEYVRKRRTGDELNIYIQIDRNNWCFFQYKRNIMQVISSDKEVNQLIMDMDISKRQTKMENGQYYQYTIGSKRRMTQFVDRFEEFWD